MRLQTARSWLLPATFVVLILGTGAGAVLESQLDWEALHSGTLDEEESRAFEQKAEAAGQLHGAAAWIAIPLLLAALVDMSLRWNHGPPQWYRRHRTVAIGFAALLVVWIVDVLAYRRLLPQSLHYALSLNLYAFGLYGSIFVGHRLVHGRFAEARRALRTTLAWMIGLTVFWPLLSLLVLVPDPTSEDLLFFTLPMTALCGLVALSLLAVASAGPVRGVVNPIERA